MPVTKNPTIIQKRIANSRFLKRSKRKHIKTQGYVSQQTKKRKHKAIRNEVLKQYQIIENTADSELCTYLHGHYFDETLIMDELIVPRIFRFSTENQNTTNFIKSVYSSLFNSRYDRKVDKITLSFRDCKELSLPPLLILSVIIDDYIKWHKKCLNKGVSDRFLASVELEQKMDKQIANRLFLMNFPVKPKIEGTIPILGFNELGKRNPSRKFSQNSKGRITRKIRSYMSDCLFSHGFDITPKAVGSVEDMINEILANCDDHSELDFWYVYGAYFGIQNPKKKEDFIGEFNLIVLTFGPSIFEGFMKNRKEHRVKQSLSEMSNLYAKAIPSHLRDLFDKESMYTLYALQEGYSRLLHEDESRGAGTMNFIEAFLSLADHDEELESALSILSGHAYVKCTKKFEPFRVDSRRYMSLNDSKDLTRPPSENSVKSLSNAFPGTILQTKVFLKKDYLKKIANGTD
jgi:hypothetical protein